MQVQNIFILRTCPLKIKEDKRKKNRSDYSKTITVHEKILRGTEGQLQLVVVEEEDNFLVSTKKSY